MRNFTKKYITLIVCSVVLAITVSSCSKDKYYQDGGLAEPKFNGTVLQYLQSNPVKFDTIVQVIKLAGMEDAFSKENITFFAPTDEVVRRTIGIVNGNIPLLQNRLNQRLFNLNKDTIKQLSDIPPVIWRKYLQRYIMKGKYLMKDFPQLDFDLRPLYPGGYYYGYNGDLLNVGVVYNSANSVRYAGYRQLCIAAVVDPSNPSAYYFSSAAVATSDVQPTNGVVHVLAQFVPNTTRLGDIRLDQWMAEYFGMWMDFQDDVILNK
ncbi:MAG: fasciclin domain-containing protein [Bacteroidota bacterium]